MRMMRIIQMKNLHAQKDVNSALKIQLFAMSAGWVISWTPKVYASYVIQIAKYVKVLKKANAMNVMMAGYFTCTVGVISVFNFVQREQIK